MKTDYSDQDIAALQAQIDAQPLDSDALKTAFDPLLGMAETRNLSHRLNCAIAQETVQRPQASPWRMVASFAAAIAIGAGLSWSYLSPKNDWLMEVAHYQALYVPDTLNPITLTEPQLQTQFDRAGKALGLTLDPAAFAKVKGLKLRRAQVLGFEGAPLVQIAFSLPDGTPFAFCIVRKDGMATALKQSILVGLASTSWQTKTHGFIAIGNMDPDQNRALAEKLMRQL